MSRKTLGGIFLAAATVIAGYGILTTEEHATVTGRLSGVGCDNFGKPGDTQYNKIHVVEQGGNVVALDIKNFWQDRSCSADFHAILLGQNVSVDYKRNFWSDITDTSPLAPKKKVVDLRLQ